MSPRSFPRSTRFVPGRILGQGAFGTVYAARDLERGQDVALKLLDRTDPSALARFKQEFRGLAEVRHPNLVRLHELHHEDGRWFFTMELVESGRSPLEWLHVTLERPAPTTVDFERDSLGLDASVVSNPEALETRSDPEPVDAYLPVDLERLKSVFHAIVQGVRALHDRGILHRDLKPSNVLVDPTGRVRILDFGIIGTDDGEERSEQRTLVGTPQYMAPEAWDRTGVGPATDWFALGVMLHQALTGTGPGFAPGSRQRVTLPEPDDPALRRLVALTEALLDPDPAARPDGEALEAALAPGDGPALPAPTRLGQRPFLGRDAELDRLAATWKATRDGRQRITLVLGRSGAGKSTLVQRFLKDLRGRHEVTVVTARCYQQERVPFKALDAVVDGLSRVLSRLPAVEVERVMPWHRHELVQVFPVLGRVPADAGPRRGFTDDPQEVRRRAFRALAALLGALHDRRPVVVYLDDLQWGDRESARVLADLLTGPDAPPIHLVGTCRSDEREDSPFLQAWGGWFDRAVEAGHAEVIQIGPLAPESTRRLTRFLFGEHPVPPGIADAIAREADGSPMFVEELVRHQLAARQGGGDRAAPKPVDLHAAIDARVDALQPVARGLLEHVAVAGRPLRRDVLFAAAGGEGEVWNALDHLLGERLVRRRTLHDDDAVEAIHDRVREAVIRLLPDDRRRSVHRALADAAARHDPDDREEIARRYAAAEAWTDASPFAARAGADALAGLAFERAAELFGLALRDPTVDDRTRARWLADRAGALVEVGRTAEAAALYDEAAALSDAPHPLLRRAAEQWVRSGRTDEGLARYGRLAEALSLPWTRSARASVTGFLLRALRVGWQVRRSGPASLPGPAAAEDPARREALEVCWSAAHALEHVDPARARFLSAVGAERAQAGPPDAHRARALGDLGVRVLPWSRQGGRRLLEAGRVLALGMEATDLRAVFDYFDAQVALAEGRPLRALELLDPESAGSVAVGDGLGAQATTLLGDTLAATGRVDQLRRLVEDQRYRFRERGSAFGTGRMRLQQVLLHLADDQPQAAREVLFSVEAASGGTPRTDRVLAWQRLLLYEGDAPAAWARLDAAWSALARSPEGRDPEDATRRWAHRGVLAARFLRDVGGPLSPRAARGQVQRAARALRRLGRADARAHARLLDVATALVAGATAEALTALDEAARVFEETGHEGHALALGVLRRQLRGEPVEPGLARLRARTIVRPDRWVAAQLPFAPAL